MISLYIFTKLVITIQLKLCVILFMSNIYIIAVHVNKVIFLTVLFLSRF